MMIHTLAIRYTTTKGGTKKHAKNSLMNVKCIFKLGWRHFTLTQNTFGSGLGNNWDGDLLFKKE